jgi:copper chaperone NosL
MKRISMGMVFVFVLLAGLLSVSGVFAADDITAHKNCSYCGMDRGVFSHSRMLIEYDDGTAVGTCSIHCAAVDLALKIDKTPKAIMVADFNTKELIDAGKAYWTIGGSKMGVMTKRAKWAFKGKSEARAFITKNGGNPATFDEAMKAAYEDMYTDTKMIRDKRKMKKMSKTEHKH